MHHISLLGLFIISCLFILTEPIAISENGTNIANVSDSFFGSCYQKTKCEECTKTKSWYGKNCRWCLLDRGCHDYGSVQNPCSEAQSINSTPKCNSVLPKFSAGVSWQQLVLSSAAYSDDPQTCLDNAPMHTEISENRAMTSDPLDLGLAGGAGFVVFHRFAVYCDFLDNKCFGYTAVSTKLQVIALSFRGTHAPTQLLLEILEAMVAPRVVVLGGKVQRYFMDAFDLLWPCAKGSVEALVRKYPNYRVFVTGHSLGGALANLAATLLVEDKIVSSSQLLQYTFGEPRVGNFDYAYAHDIRVNNSWRVVHYRDIVPHIPLCLDPFCSGSVGGPYQHGLEVFYDSIEMNVSSPHSICQGTPHNEDFGCSDGVITEKPCLDMNDCILYHLHYYDIQVSDWPKGGCKQRSRTNGAMARVKNLMADLRDAVAKQFFGADQVDFSKDTCRIIAASGNRVALDFESWRFRLGTHFLYAAVHRVQLMFVFVFVVFVVYSIHRLGLATDRVVTRISLVKENRGLGKVVIGMETKTKPQANVYDYQWKR